jgi:cobalt transporter subunit CbtA
MGIIKTSHIFIAAIIGGLIAGLFLTGIQQIAVGPLIQEAENYETAAPAHEHAAGVRAHTHDEDAWAPQDGAERLLYTAMTNVLTAVGFALLLSAAFAMRGGVDWRRGLLWGLAGFVAFNGAPSVGLPPELPGAVAAPLIERQVWWVATVVLTAGGLAVLAFAPRPAIKVAGLVLIALPHVVGAPHPEGAEGLAPAALEHQFIYASLITNGIFWVVLGALVAFVFGRLRGGQHAAA